MLYNIMIAYTYVNNEEFHGIGSYIFKYCTNYITNELTWKVQNQNKQDQKNL